MVTTGVLQILKRVQLNSTSTRERTTDRAGQGNENQGEGSEGEGGVDVDVLAQSEPESFSECPLPSRSLVPIAWLLLISSALLTPNPCSKRVPVSSSVSPADSG